jgi:hypothetical protein
MIFSESYSFIWQPWVATKTRLFIVAIELRQWPPRGHATPTARSWR